MLWVFTGVVSARKRKQILLGLLFGSENASYSIQGLYFVQAEKTSGRLMIWSESALFVYEKRLIFLEQDLSGYTLKCFKDYFISIKQKKASFFVLFCFLSFW